MKTRKKTSAQLSRALLRLLAQKNWEDLSLELIAKTAKIPLREARSLCHDLSDLVPCVVAMIDEEVAASVDSVSKDQSLEDRLFDVMMTRFEILQRYRKGILKLSEAARRDPSLAYKLFHATQTSMKNVVRHAQLEVENFSNIITLPFLQTAYFLTFCKWSADETPDLTATMASLNNTIYACKKVFCFPRTNSTL